MANRASSQALANTLYRQVTTTPTTRQSITQTNARLTLLQEPLLHQLPDARYRFHCWLRLGDVRTARTRPRTNGDTTLITIQWLQQRYGQSLGQQ